MHGHLNVKSQFVSKSLRTKRGAKWKGKILVIFEITSGHGVWSEAVFQWLYLRGDMLLRYSGE